MDEIEIIIFSTKRNRKIAISSHTLLEVIGSICYLVFTKNRTSDKGFRPSRTIGIRIIFLQKCFEMIRMMSGKLYKQQHIWIFCTDEIFYSRIVCIVLVNIGKQDFEIA